MYLGDLRVTPQIVLKNLPVSRATAHRWCHRKSIPALAKELLTLKLNGKVMPPTWGGFRFDNEGLLWSATDYHFTAAALDQMHYIHSRNQSVNNHNKDLMEYIDYLETVKPRARVVPFPYELTRPSATLGKNNNTLFDKPPRLTRRRPNYPKKD